MRNNRQFYFYILCVIFAIVPIAASAWAADNSTGKLILQGAEDGYDKMRDGLGWTMAISEENGQVVLTASGEQVAFVIFGASLPM